jgi:hypothetical protein
MVPATILAREWATFVTIARRQKKRLQKALLWGG